MAWPRSPWRSRATDALPMAARGAAWSAGLTAGYGWLVRDRRVLVRVGAGVQYWGFTLDEGAGIDGLYPDVDLVVGYRF
ncbi:MAG: hypothetical protein NT062_22380 [Proteobacteria bacterium]|nr:hypothetical protein [Pseudomonadota bacterium]